MVSIRRVAPWAVAFVAAGVPLLILLPARGAVTPAAPVTIDVPAMEPTIQAAITAARSGDTIVVAPGTYAENLDFHGKAITLTSAQGPATTVIDGGGRAPVVTFQSAETPASVLEGFTLRDGAGPADPRYGGGGVRILGASPTITGDVITANAACSGGGLMATGGAPIIRGDTVSANLASLPACSFGGGAGVELLDSDAQLTGNTVSGNSQAADGAGVYVSGGSPTILGNVISGNTAAPWAGAGGITLDATAALVVQNLITANSGGAAGGVTVDGVPPGGHPTLVNDTIAADQGDAVMIYGAPAAPAVELDGDIVVGVPGKPALVCDGNPLAPAFLDDDLFTEGTPAASGCALGPPPNGNISIDPGFVDPAHGDFHLTATSPSVDSGDPTAPGLPVTDLDGAPRVQGARVDQGVYEFAGTSAYVPHMPATITVPGDAPTISAAIAAAHDGDTVLVSPGRYRDNLDFGGKAITVESAQGPQATSIDGGRSDPVVTFRSGEGRESVLRGFTIENGDTPMPEDHGGGGVYIDDASPTIAGNIVSGNGACGPGAGIDAEWGGAPLIEDNTVSGNGQGPCTGGGGIAVSGAGAQIVGNTVTGNTGGASAVTVSGPGPVLVEGNVITGNQVDGRGGGLTDGASQSNIVGNLIAGNTAMVSGGVQAGAGAGGGILFANNTIAANKGEQLELGGGGSRIELDGNVIDGGGSHQQAVVCLGQGAVLPVILTDNDLFGGKGPALVGCTGAPATGEISADPHFVDPKHGNFRLAPGSPAVDSGDPAAPYLPATDLDGSPRVQGAAVDMGAYESTPLPPTGTVGSLSVTWSKTSLLVVWAAPAGGTPASSYRVTLGPTGKVKTVKASSTSATFTKLKPSTTAYTVTVVAVGVAGAGAPATLTVPPPG